MGAILNVTPLLTFPSVSRMRRTDHSLLNTWHSDRSGRKDQSLKIGMVAAAGGVLGEARPPQVAGVRLGIAEVNAAGGIFGEEVVLTIVDSIETMENSATTAPVSDLISFGVSAIIGGAGIPVTPGVVEDITDAGVVLFTLSSSPPDVIEPSDFLFSASPTHAVQGSAIAHKMLGDGSTAAAVFTINDPYARAIRDECLSVFRNSGADFNYGSEGYAFSMTDVDYWSMVAGALSTRPDSIAIIAPPKSTREIILRLAPRDGKGSTPSCSQTLACTTTASTVCPGSQREHLRGLEAHSLGRTLLTPFGLVCFKSIRGSATTSPTPPRPTTQYCSSHSRRCRVAALTVSLLGTISPLSPASAGESTAPTGTVARNYSSAIRGSLTARVQETARSTTTTYPLPSSSGSTSLVLTTPTSSWKRSIHGPVEPRRATSPSLGRAPDQVSQRTPRRLARRSQAVRGRDYRRSQPVAERSTDACSELHEHR